MLAQDGGTLVWHSYETTRPPLRPFRAVYGVLLSHHKDMRPAMQHTLDQLAESVGARTVAPPTGEEHR